MLVRVRNPEYGRDVWRFHQPEYFEYVGDEVKLKHVGADCMALTTGISEFPVRVIRRSLIDSIDGTAVESPSSKTLQRTVRGSKGEEYVVSNAGSGWQCTCAGFQFRRSCRHARQAAAA